jgi:hypothetical protein
MNIHHDKAPLGPTGNHPAYRGYDVFEGKLRSLHGEEHQCPACERRFASVAALEQHCRDRHTGGEGA